MAQARICFLGDSFVLGFGDPEYLGWAGRICAAARREGHDVTCYNLGIRRETSSDIRARWQQEIRPRLPSPADGRIIFSFGANDAALENGAPRVSLEDSLANARDMLETAKQTYPVLMVGSPPLADPARNAGAERISAEHARLCQELGVPYLDVFTPLSSSGVWMAEARANDGTHPRAGGYTQMAELVMAWSVWRNWLGAE